MRCGCSHSRSGILSPDAARAGGDVIMFVGRGLSFSELSASSLSSLDPCSDYVGVGISLNGSFSLSFLDVCARLFAPLRRMAGLTPSGTQEVLPTPAERKHWTGSSQLTSSPSMTLTHPPFCIAPLAVTPPLTSPLLPPFLPFIAPWRCFKAWVLTTYQFFNLSLSHPSRRSPSFNFRKARRDDFVSCFASHCPSAEEYSSLSLSSAAGLVTSLVLNAAKSSIPFGRIKRHPKAWRSSEAEDAVSERRKAFAAAHRSDEDRQAYICASRRASSVIAKAEAWQTTCSLFSPKSNPKTVYSLLRWLSFLLS